MINKIRAYLIFGKKDEQKKPEVSLFKIPALVFKQYKYIFKFCHIFAIIMAKIGKIR